MPSSRLRHSGSHRPISGSGVLQPGDRYDAQPDAAGSQELFLVLNGALTLEVEGLEPVTVKAGGSARLASDRSYAYANRGREPARYVRVVRLG
jgi:mannose-6-phosphate isomerase-like protein (cupin superfamily)